MRILWIKFVPYYFTPGKRDNRTNGKVHHISAFIGASLSNYWRDCHCAPGHQVRSIKPDRQGLLRSTHDSACCKTNLVLALATLHHSWPTSLKTPRITDLTTGWTFETIWPPDTFQMASAGRFIRKEMLKLQ